MEESHMMETEETNREAALEGGYQVKGIVWSGSLSPAGVRRLAKFAKDLSAPSLILSSE
jgi:hypothetical protein